MGIADDTRWLDAQLPAMVGPHDATECAHLLGEGGCGFKPAFREGDGGRLLPHFQRE